MAPVNRLHAPRHHQRGAASIFAAVSLVTLLSAVGLAIDVGRLYYANRDLQRLADLAAIDGARVQSQCLGSAGLDEVTAEVEASLLRNRVQPLTNKTTLLGLRSIGADGLQYFAPTLVPGGAADSVQVTLSLASPARILPLFAGDDSRTLTVRAAAQSKWVASAEIDKVPISTSVGNFTPQFYGGALRASLGSGAGGFLGGANATVAVGDLLIDTGDVTGALPPTDVQTPVLGVLSNLEALLNNAGDIVAAQLVSTYAAAIAIGRPGAMVVPAEVLGLPLQGGYDNATISVGGVLNAIAGSVSQGDVIQLPNLCALLPLDQLPTAQLLPALCDSTVELAIPQPSRPGISNSGTQILDLNNDEGGATSGGGLLRVRLKLINPLSGQPIDIPLMASAAGSAAKVTALSCVRMGQATNIANVQAKGPVITFALGDSNTFNNNFTSQDVDLARVLNDTQPVPLLNASVQDILINAGVSSLLLNNGLFAGFLGQAVTISVLVNPVSIGDNRVEDFCMQGPPFGVPEQCNGAPATIGGVNEQDVVSRLSDALGSVQLVVTLPNNLPLGLGTLLQGPVNALTAALSTQLQGALSLLAPQLVPILQSANLAVGESAVYLRSAEGTQPHVYAQ